ncbi:MAG: SxtJ family membrane protein [Fidelibacterota bacterium]
MIEEIKQIVINRDKKEFRKFGITIGVFLMIVGAFLFFRTFEHAMTVGLIGVAFLLLGVLLPKILRPFYIAWMSLASMLGFVMTRVILSLVFYLIFTPVGLMLRLLRKDLLNRKIEPDQPSYWELRPEKEYDPKSSEKQY